MLSAGIRGRTPTDLTGSSSQRMSPHFFNIRNNSKQRIHNFTLDSTNCVSKAERKAESASNSSPRVLLHRILRDLKRRFLYSKVCSLLCSFLMQPAVHAYRKSRRKIIAIRNDVMRPHHTTGLEDSGPRIVNTSVLVTATRTPSYSLSSNIQQCQ